MQKQGARLPVVALPMHHLLPMERRLHMEVRLGMVVRVAGETRVERLERGQLHLPLTLVAQTNGDLPLRVLLRRRLLAVITPLGEGEPLEALGNPHGETLGRG